MKRKGNVLGDIARNVIYLNLRYCFSRYDTMLFEGPAFRTYPDEGGSRPFQNIGTCIENYSVLLLEFVIIVLKSVGTSNFKTLFNSSCFCYFQTSVCSILGLA